MVGQLTNNLHQMDGPLLSEGMANLITSVSLATRISLRCSTLFFDTLFDVAKYGTSLSLSLSRNAISNALITAKSLHNQKQLTYENDESLFYKVLEKYTNLSIYVVNHTFSLAELFTMSGLQFTSKTLLSSLKAAEESVRIIDGIFGSNETSRAIAAFISLIHRELMHDPEFSLAKAGKIAILKGLTKALTAFAVLQTVTHKRMMKQMPVTILWEGIVKDEKEEDDPNKLIKFKHNSHSQLPPPEQQHILSELSNLVLDQKSNNSKESKIIKSGLSKLSKPILSNAYKVLTKTTHLTTYTTTISPIDDPSGKKKIIVRSHQENNKSYLALLNQHQPSSSLPQFFLTSLNEKSKKRKVDRQEIKDINHRPQHLLHRRFSSPDYDPQLKDDKKIQSTSLLQTFSSHPSLSSFLDMKKKKRSSSLSSPSSQFNALTMTTTHTQPIPTSCASSVHSLDISQDPQDENHRVVNNIAHYMRYASAAYGESFMRILGIGDIPTDLPNSRHHHPNHHAFAHHTGNSVEDILLSSYTDRSPLHLHNPSIHALVHYVTVDHNAQAIVLTCRGTLGLSDILTDLSFEYREFNLDHQSRTFKAHSGMLDAAQLLAMAKGKVYQKIKQGLDLYPDYGLVMCGHSLGAGVASLLCVLWSDRTDTGFLTSIESGLPPGRSIHCYAYGPPGVMSLELSQYCAGLVTSVVHGYDFVTCLSLGILKDFKNIATSLEVETEATEEIISRVAGRLQKKKEELKEGEFTEDDQWFWAMIKTMRADMTSEKMYPPNTVYMIETIPHAKKQHKVILSRCEDVQARFSEIVFTRTMFMDHSPLMYENAIRKLHRGLNQTLL